MRLLRLFLLLLLILSLAPSAAALVCPPPGEVKQKNGWWSAPGGWQQRQNYKAPTPAASISEFTGASFEGNLRGPGRMLCFYAVKGQPGVEYTLLTHPSKGGPMDFDWDCPPMDKNITCTCTGFKRTDCEVRD